MSLSTPHTSPAMVPGRTARNRRPAVARQSEEAIHRALADLLSWAAAPGVVWWHTPNGEARSRSGAGRLKAMGTKAGMPDLFLLMGGKLYALEIKTDTGRVSPAQAEQHRALTASGAAVWVAHGYDAAEGWLKRMGLVRCRRG